MVFCALLLTLTSSPAWGVCRPENRVGNFFPEPPKTAADFASQPVDTRPENAGCGYDFASGVHKYLYCQADPVDGSDPSGHAVYFVERHFQGPASVAWPLNFGHGYLLFSPTSDPGGDPFKTHQQPLNTFSWHPYSWDYDQNARPGVPGRVWEDHPEDRSPGGWHHAFLVTTDSGQQSALLNFVKGWIAAANPGREYGDPIWETPAHKNQVGNPHKPAPPGGVYYSLHGQNCVWWSAVMLMQSGINVPDRVYNAISGFNHGVGNADTEIGLGLSDTAYDVGTLNGRPLGVQVSGLPGYNLSGFNF